jgi:signal transduction histidine kinase/ActR/RegA family two-component response regulator
MGVWMALLILVTTLRLRTLAPRSRSAVRHRRDDGTRSTSHAAARDTGARPGPPTSAQVGGPELARLKALFLTDVGHQLRTPLNGLLGMAELLLRSDLTREQRLIVERLLESGAGLLTATEDVLDLMALVADDLDPRVADFDVRATVDDVVRLHRARAARNQTVLDVAVAFDVPEWLHGEVGRLRVVLANLVANAIEHTTDGEVHVDVVRYRGDSFQFSVTDTGVGIPPAVLSTLFAVPHHRDDARLGTGLALSQRVVTAMGGEMGASSVPGAGSVFHFTVPLTTVRSDTVAALPPTLPARRPVVLVVEDDALIRDVTARQLEQAGYGVHTSINGAEAVAMLRSDKVDAVFMDCAMPVMDGFEATRQIRREISGGLELPIIALTALEPEDGLERCLRVGMNGYVPKPASSDALIASLRAHGVRVVEPA